MIVAVDIRWRLYMKVRRLRDVEVMLKHVKEGRSYMWPCGQYGTDKLRPHYITLNQEFKQAGEGDDYT